jgi:hypothetical protein
VGPPHFRKAAPHRTSGMPGVGPSRATPPAEAEAKRSVRNQEPGGIKQTGQPSGPQPPPP